MPSIAAGSYPVENVPTVSPQAPAGDFQRIEANPEAFGAGIGAAEQGLGQRIGQFSDVLAKQGLERQDLYNKTTADQATNNWQDETNKILYGDPNDPNNKTGFFGLKGQGAMNAYPGVRDAIFAARDKYANQLNPIAKLQFDNESRRLQSYMVQGMGRHYDDQMTRYTIEQAKATTVNATSAMIGAANSGDEDSIIANASRAIESVKTTARALGQKEDDPSVQEQIDKIHNTAVRAQSEYLRATNPIKGLDFIETNAKLFNQQPGEYEAEHERMRAAAKDMQGKIDARIIPKPQSWDSSKSGGVPKIAEIGQKYGKFITAASTAYNVPEQMISSVIAAESGGDPNSETILASGHKVQGLGNILDDTSKELGITNPFNPEQNIQGIAKTLRQGLDKYNGDTEKALKYYYGGRDESKWGPLTDGYPARVAAFMPKQVGASEMPPVGPKTGIDLKTIKVAGQGAAPTTPTFGAGYPTGAIQPAGVQHATIPGYTGDIIIPPPDQDQAPDTQFTGLTEQLDQIPRDILKDKPNISPREFQDRVDNAVKQLRAVRNDAYRQERQQATLNKEADAKVQEQLKGDYITRMAPGADNPPTIKEIMADPKLNSTVKENLVNFAERNGKEDPAAAVDAQNKNDLMRRIHLPYGTDGKITTDQAIIDAYTAKPPQITYNSSVQLRKELADSRTPDGENLINEKRRMHSQVLPAIYGPMAMTPEDRAQDAQQAASTGRESADQRLARFDYDLDKKIQDMKDANKDWHEVFNPKSPDYFGSTEKLKQYQAPLKEKLTKDTTKSSVLPYGSALDQMNEQQLKAFASQSPANYDLAIDEFARRGDARAIAAQKARPPKAPEAK